MPTLDSATSRVRATNVRLVGDPVLVTPQDDPTGAADEPGSFRSELVLRPGWWRQFSQELVALAWVAVAIPCSWVVWWQWGGPAELLLIAVIITAWSLYAGGSWARRALRRRAVLSSAIPTLVLDDLGIRVRHPFGNLDGAYLTWVDCAAAVVSRAPTAGRTPESYRAYVEFVPVAPDRIEGAPRKGDQRRVLLDRPPDQVRMVWMELTGVGRSSADVAAWLRERRPDLPLVDSTGPHSARTL